VRNIKLKTMAIDFSTQTDQWWIDTFERYITGGNAFGTRAEGGWDSIKKHYEACIPAGDFPDRELVDTGREWIIRATHPRAGRFNLTVQKGDKSWAFEWEGN
jgi:hypothetical protein